ncbi:acetylxylan esterase [Sphaerochaeta sp. PS]|uniref:alpha/beta hydrolase family protein n=1 Tax=Sphaerochaeta sp. PS TaxID=3076336 RepID=UPI0028A3E951|nr:acetylxylan esterase [Sphaerochaeta sp. PS]MDT4762303.1 acetylxylan esterase [Sphaerochaeta sp. PS]
MKQGKTWKLLYLAIILMVGGSLLASWVNSGLGKVRVDEVSIWQEPGFSVSAYVYTPKNVAEKMPAILAIHGLNNQKNHMANTALEFARRGYVVLSMDMSGHGRTTGKNLDHGAGGPAGLAYLKSLPNVDTDNIGIVGMSQGGFAGAMGAILSDPEGYSSVFFMESEVSSPGSMDLSAAKYVKNAAFNIGTVTELGVMIFVGKGSEAPVSPVLQPLFATDAPIEAGKIYGSIEDGTARILYQPWEDHAGATDSIPAIANALEWMHLTLTGGNTLSPRNQIWPIKLIGTTLALLGAMLFLFPMGSLLLNTNYFGELKEKLPEYRGYEGKSWWVSALITTALGPLLYLFVWNNMFFVPWINPNRLWPQNFTNVYMVWSVLVGAIAIVLMIAGHYTTLKGKGARLEHYGLTDASGTCNWVRIFKSGILAICTLLPVYLILVFIDSVWKVDFRVWVVTLLPFTGRRFLAFLGYLVPFALYFIPQGIILSGFQRPKKGNLSLGKEMLINSIVMTLGAVIWLLILYIPILAGGSIIFGSNPLVQTAAGMGGIYYLPLLVLWPLVACLYTYFFRKTGRVYVGISMTTLFIVWYLTAAGVFAVAL